MGEIKIKREEILLLLREDTQQQRDLYDRIRRIFVDFLKAQQLDWKIGKEKKRSKLFHAALSLACHHLGTEQHLEKKVLQTGRRLYVERYPEKELDRDGLIELPPIAKDSLLMEAETLENWLNSLQAKDANPLKAIFVEHKTLEELAKDDNRSVEEFEAALLSSLSKMTTELGTLDWSTVSISEVDGKNCLLTVNKQTRTILAPISNGFLALSQIHFEEKLNHWEKIRQDNKQMKVLLGKNETHQRELYWQYRKEFLLAFEERNFTPEVEKRGDLMPLVWSTFLGEMKAVGFNAQLKKPLIEHLFEILKEGKMTDKIKPKVEEWETMIAAEEMILDKIKSKDQRFLSQLVSKIAPEFTSILRKIFGLYESSVQDRPGEIYYRCFAEVVYKVEKEELTKPLTSTFRTYLIGVGANVYRQEYFKRGEIYADIDEEITENVQEECRVENKYQAEENAAKVARYLAAIGDPCKSLIEMYHLRGFTHGAIAERIGKKEGAVRTQIHRCMDKLRKMIFTKN